MASKFKVHELNLAIVVAMLQRGDNKVFLHGDGNVYDNKEASDFRKEFSNPKDVNSKHRIIFTSLRQIPAELEDLDDLFFKQAQIEDAAERAVNTATGVKVKTITLEKKTVETQKGQPLTQAQLDDLELQRQIAEEEAKKEKDKV